LLLHSAPSSDGWLLLLLLLLLAAAGYFGSFGREYSVWATMWYHRHLTAAEDFGDRAMPYGEPHYTGNLQGWLHHTSKVVGKIIHSMWHSRLC
jgi:hypothetical protein